VPGFIHALLAFTKAYRDATKFQLQHPPLFNQLTSKQKREAGGSRFCLFFL